MAPITQAPEAHKSRSNKLDALRGIAALVVVFHHGLYALDYDAAVRVRVPALSELSGYDLALRLIASVALGEIAVFVFFVLSGAVLMDSLRREGPINMAAAVRFTGRRVFRIVPAMAVAIVAFAILTHIHLPTYLDRPFSGTSVIRNVLMIDHGVLGVTWTLRTEMLMVPILLGLALFRNIFGTMSMIFFLSVSQYFLAHGVPYFDYLLVHALTAFGLGALATTEMFRTACKQLPKSTLWLLLAGLVAVRFVASTSSPLAVFALLWIAAITVALLYHDRDPNHPLERPTLVFLGRISYGVYLLHWIVIYWPLGAYQALIGAERLSANVIPWYFLYMIFVVPVTVLFAVPLERFVERPFIEMGHRLFPRGHKRGNVVPLQQEGAKRRLAA
ncbi:MAG: acyltransferase [Rhizobiaceae bacterium]|nr:acyltransferase [Rhizobiaceae bacterium]